MSRTSSRFLRSTVAVILASVALLATTTTAGAGAVRGDTADLVVPFDRDVFVIVGSTLRNPDETTPDSAPLFNVAGVGLGRTWGQWKAAGATSVMRASRKGTDVSLTFSGLVPSGVYSVFYGTFTPDSENPLCPGVERTLPVTSTNKRQVPDASSFVAGGDGSAAFAGRIPGDPLATALQVFVVLVYHLDGKTYGSLPNAGEFTTQPDCRSSFGEDAMRQLFIQQKG